ncbi:hypothetical protein BD410DRAFT_808530 [Rickenella mellea]|uniref:Uncharacterized protein n=1 Tax=Rickenella mellea TaxID=50990 RepID=A0A4Y7PMU7_9AGAM|nr:hypothetical protein BD410DRAFT_808530 [Rickenella mellea]
MSVPPTAQNLVRNGISTNGTASSEGTDGVVGVPSGREHLEDSMEPPPSAHFNLQQTSAPVNATPAKKGDLKSSLVDGAHQEGFWMVKFSATQHQLFASPIARTAHAPSPSLDDIHPFSVHEPYSPSQTTRDRNPGRTFTRSVRPTFNITNAKDAPRNLSSETHAHRHRPSHRQPNVLPPAPPFYLHNTTGTSDDMLDNIGGPWSVREREERGLCIPCRTKSRNHARAVAQLYTERAKCGHVHSCAASSKLSTATIGLLLAAMTSRPQPLIFVHSHPRSHILLVEDVPPVLVQPLTASAALFSSHPQAHPLAEDRRSSQPLLLMPDFTSSILYQLV